MGSATDIHSPTKKLVEVFADDPENDSTFYGFSDSELKELNMFEENEGPLEDEAPSEPPAAFQSFRLRIALRSAPVTEHFTDSTDVKEGDKTMRKRGRKRPRNHSTSKIVRHVKSEDVETAVSQLLPLKEQQSDSDEDLPDSFLAKRELNIRNNKAMLAQLMADLQNMPGGAGLLKNPASKQKTKNKSSHPPRSEGQFRRNPERVSRRQTRSMGLSANDGTPQEEDVERNLEEELLEVRQAPRRRGTLRPSQSKPHIVCSVDEITEEELQLVADNMTEKVYNSVTGSTCHQCRQKTIDTKTCCRSNDCRGIQGQFCGPCLRNRYGEDVRKALLDPDWKCPPCRGICNCSFCRQRDGRCPTGILFPLAQYHGFSDVHSYLSSLCQKLKGEEKMEN